MILETLVGAVNNDTNSLSASVGVKFPKHLTDEAVSISSPGGGYFDFKGRDGLINKINSAVQDQHFLVGIVRNQKHKQALEQLTALRKLRRARQHR
jgi:hypothetical protein